MYRDIFGKDVVINNKKLWLFDLDGTVYEEERVFEGTFELLANIKKIGGKYVFITNNSSRSVMDYVKKINKLGIEGGEENFLTSAMAAIFRIKKDHPGAKVYCQGTGSFIAELKDSGIDVTEKVEPVDIVLVGYDMELSMDKIQRTCEILSTQNPVYIATNPDWACPVRFGFIPDCGSICQMIEHATGKKPVFVGKPQKTMIEIAMEKSGFNKEETVVIGDRLYTDILAGINAGVSTICVLTGEASEKSIKEGDIKPDYVFMSVKEINEALKAF